MSHSRVAAMAVVSVLVGLPMGISVQTAAASTNNNRDAHSSPNARITQSNTRTTPHSRSMLTEIEEVARRASAFQAVNSDADVQAVLDTPSVNLHFVRQPAGSPDQLGVLQWIVERIHTRSGNKFRVKLVDSDERVRIFPSAQRAAQHMGLPSGATFESSMDTALPH